MAHVLDDGRKLQRLRSWKEIAAYFGTDERTVRRWQERGLPVRRVPGSARGPVYADVCDLQDWLSRREEASKSLPEAPAEPASPRGPRRGIIAAVLLVVAALTGGGLWFLEVGRTPPEVSIRRPSPKAVELYLSGTYQSSRLDAQSLHRAISLFGEAIAEDPGYAEPHAGLAYAYLRLRGVDAEAEPQAGPRARAAAERALQLNPNLALAHAAMGMIRFYWDWDFQAGLRHFRLAAELDPSSASGHHNFGMALLHAGRFDEALAAIEAGQRLSPTARGIRSEMAYALYWAGRREQALAVLQELLAEDPDYVQPHQFLALIRFGEGDFGPGLEHARAYARLRGDSLRLPLIERASRVYAQGGREAMLRTMLAGQQRLVAQGIEPVYVLAGTYALMGEREAALRHLRRSVAMRERAALMMRIDPLLRSLHGDPRFERLAPRIGRS